MWLPVRRSWRLNERHYGALQGKDKAQTLAEFGEEQFMMWRRSYDTPPPPLDIDDKWSQFHDPKYATLPPEVRPRTECLADVVDRMLPYWYDAIVPDLLTGATVLVAAHGNSLRALVKHLDDMDPDTVVGLNIPTGHPVALRPRRVPAAADVGGAYLDPDAAAAAIEAVKNQGRALTASPVLARGVRDVRTVTAHGQQEGIRRPLAQRAAVLRRARARSSTASPDRAMRSP